MKSYLAHGLSGRLVRDRCRALSRGNSDERILPNSCRPRQEPTTVDWLLKDVGVDPPLPNYKREWGKGVARWDAYFYVLDPDALAAEFASRSVEFSEPPRDADDGLRGFELKDADGYVLFFGRPRS
jgi:hypothetical protein